MHSYKNKAADRIFFFFSNYQRSNVCLDFPLISKQQKVVEFIIIKMWRMCTVSVTRYSLNHVSTVKGSYHLSREKSGENEHEIMNIWTCQEYRDWACWLKTMGRIGHSLLAVCTDQWFEWEKPANLMEKYRLLFCFYNFIF